MNKNKTLATTFERAEDSPGFLLWQLSNKWQSQQRTALKPFGLTHMQFVLLATLTFVAGRRTFTQKQLADYVEVDVMMTSQVLRKLEQKGLVSRIPGQTDRRSFILKPTTRGAALASQTVKVVEKVDENLFGAIGSDTARMITMMKRLIKS